MAAAAALAAIGISSGAQIAGGLEARSQSKDEARRLERAGELAAERERRSNDRVRAAQRVAFAKSGVDPASPTAIDVAAEAAHTGELNALRRQFIFEEEARRTREAGNAAALAGITGGLLSVLGGAGKLKGLGVIGSGAPSPSTAPAPTGGGKV